MSVLRSGLLLLSLIAGLLPATISAQAGRNPPPPPPDQPTSPYTLQVNTRVVLTDVTVTDAKGNPVSGLSGADFHIFDNGKPQKIGSFEEHAGERTAPGAFTQASASTYSNDYSVHPPPVVNVLLLDTTTIPLVDQMYLYEQLTRFVRDLPEGEPIAIFLRSGAMTLPLQAFTTNKPMLLAAIRKAVPHFREPGYWYRASDATLWQIASYLSQVPGRKNILWFSGGENLFLSPDPTTTLAPRQPLYDLLEKERIALYPIDARGLVYAGPSAAMEIGSQQMLMEQDAQATGGRAYYNTNGLAEAAQRVLNTDGDYYTLTYTPDDLRLDGKWHKVTVLAGEEKHRYRLSYRRGYYDDGQNNQVSSPGIRTLLRADGSKVQVQDDRTQPIVFQATVAEATGDAPADLPTKPLRHGQTAYRIHYVVPANDFTPQSVSGDVGVDVVGAAVLAMDHYGEPITRIGEKATLHVNVATVRSNPKSTLAFDQQINLPKGQDYLDIGLWDMTTGRIGILTVPVTVSRK